MPKLIDLTGRRFGRLLVLERGENSRHGAARWRCTCDCGNTTLSFGQTLLDGTSASCGCLNKEINRSSKHAKTHGMRATRVWRIWQGMKQRCRLPTHPSYPYCGAKGVTYDPRWESFEAFLADMGEPPTEKHTLDRIDTRGNYEKSNCRWATMKTQQNNRTNNRFITFGGETLTLAQWSERLGFSHGVITTRIDRYGWSVEKALTTPSRAMAGS